jgi:hypothetical protein
MDIGIFCGTLVHFPPILVYCTDKNLATLNADDWILAKDGSDDFVFSASGLSIVANLKKSVPPQFYFLLRIKITIINCNSSTSDVGGCLLPHLSEWALFFYSCGKLCRNCGTRVRQGAKPVSCFTRLAGKYLSTTAKRSSAVPSAFPGVD